MDKILERGIVPVAVLQRAEDAVPLAEALLAGGLDVLEITFRTGAASGALAAVSARFPEMLVGAGTLVTPAQVDEAVGAGARFGVAPGLNETVVRAALARGLPFVPGVMTPSELERAMELGCRLLKFFPAEQAGGTAMLQALAGPYGHTGVRFVPLGGIKAENAADYLRLPIVGAIGGSWLVDKKLVQAGDWGGITRRAREALEIVGRARSGVGA